MPQIISPELMNIISLLITVGGSIYGARLLYQQIIGKNTADATHTLNETITDQNALIERLQDRNRALGDLLADRQSGHRNCTEGINFITAKYKQYAPLDVQEEDLKKLDKLLRGDSGPLNKITKP